MKNEDKTAAANKLAQELLNVLPKNFDIGVALAALMTATGAIVNGVVREDMKDKAFSDCIENLDTIRNNINKKKVRPK